MSGTTMWIVDSDSSIARDLRADASAELIRSLANAFDGHRLWLTEFNRALICALPADARAGRANCCPFSRWADGPRVVDERMQARLSNLLALHEEVHQRAAELAARSRLGGGIPVGDYDAFAALSRTFAQGALDLERASRDRLAEVDPLTGLFNRRSMWRHLEAERQRGLRTRREASLAMIDLDHFKDVNDRFGHQQADVVLQNVARRFEAELRPYDTLYRYGGDEFLLCLPEASPAMAQGILRRLVQQDVLPGGESLTASIGIAALSGTVSVSTAIERADAAAYICKHSGGGRIELWRPVGTAKA